MLHDASALTQNCKRTCEAARSSAVFSPLASRALCRDLLSAFGGKADIEFQGRDVRL